MYSIRMIQTSTGSEDGVRIREYIKGQEYDMDRTDGSRDLARVFVDELSVAIKVEEVVPLVEPFHPQAVAELDSSDIGERPKPEPQRRRGRPRKGKGNSGQ